MIHVRPAWLAALAILITAAGVRAEPREYEQTQPAPTDAAVPRGEPQRDSMGRPSVEVVPELEPRRGGSNYFVLNAFDGRKAGNANERGLVKFRIDLEYDVVRAEKWDDVGYFYLTFPIRLLSFWDLFDALPGSKSAPFIETNYSPGLELSWVAPSRLASFWSVRTGVRHESNGLGVLASGIDQLSSSRSWNFVYLGTSYTPPMSGLLSLALDASGWLPFGSDPVAVWPNGRNANSRLEDHIGYFELGADLQFRFSEEAYPTLRLRGRQGSIDAQLRWPLKRAQLWDGISRNGNGFRLDLLAHCHLGNGERLIIANENRYSCYLGVGL